MIFLKNYTSNVPVSRTISRIEEVLARCGASHIAKEYGDGGVVVALQFMIASAGKNIVIKLPANPEKVFQALKAQVSKPRNGTMQRIREQSAKTAWKLQQDWVEVQLSMIEMGQAEMLQVFLPYVFNGRQTYYEVLSERGFKGLLPEKAGGE